MSNDTEELEAWNNLLELRGDSYLSRVLFSISLLIVFFASLVGNILICIVIYYNKTMHTATNYYLFDLAISDLLVTFPILIHIFQIFNNNIFEYIHEILTFKIYICIQGLFLTLMFNHGVLVITTLSIERYISICYPMMIQRIPVWQRVKKIILAIWIIAILETLPMVWTMDFIVSSKAMKCSFLFTSTAKIIALSLVVITFVIPLCIMIFMYTMIARTVNDLQRYDLNEATVHNSIFKRQNLYKLIVTLTVSFVVCWLPGYIFRILLYFTSKEEIVQLQWWFSIGYKISMFNCWFTTVLNPLLFSLVSIKFRKAFRILWDKKIKRKQRTKTDKTADTDKKI